MTSVFMRQIYRRLLSRRMASGLQRDWDLSVNTIEMDDGPVYFCSEKVLSDPTTREAVKRHGETLTETFENLEFPSSVSFAFTAYNPGDVSQSDVKNAIDYDRLEKELVKRKPFGTTVRKNYGFFPDDSSHFERGFHLITSQEIANDVRKFVNEMCLEFGQAGYFEYNTRDGCVYQDLVSVPNQKVEAVSSLVRVTVPSCHPVFAHTNYHSVFHTVTKLQQVLSEMKVSGVYDVHEHCITDARRDHCCLTNCVYCNNY